MPIQLYNTLSRTKQNFEPLLPGKVGMYVCGPTVYGYASVGNMRAYVFADTLRRMLEFNDYDVKMVMNITDVGHLVSDGDEGEDKMQSSARKEQKTPWEIAEYYAEAFIEDTGLLNIKKPTVLAWATKHIADMIAMVEELVQLGYAYETGDGIYFDIGKYPAYGQLSGQKLEELQAGARVSVNEEKRHPADFALWKKAPPEHIMQWPSPWGMGYPGWHIECSAMGRKYLGDLFDIHTGGVDHIPIHHENEIAQTAACTGEPGARYWLHNEFLLIDGGKMSKSLGNVYTIADILKRGLEPLSYRYFCHNAHYRRQLNFTWEALLAAQKGLYSLRSLVQKSITLPAGEQAAGKAAVYRQRFLDAINDDLNLPQALAILWEAAKDDLGPQLAALAKEFDGVLALDLLRGELPQDLPLTREELPQQVQNLLRQRDEARQAKDWAKSDMLRDELKRLGFLVKDTAVGAEVRIRQ